MGLGRMPGVLAAVLAVGVSLPAQQPSVFQMEFTNANQAPSHWVLKLSPDGTGQFDAEGGHVAAEDANQIQVGEVHRSVQLSAQFASQVFATARQRRLFAFPCESNLKVAFQGTKKLSYSGPEGSGTCEFNYSKDKQIQALSDSLLAVETTLMFGAKLEKLLAHERLGLDREMEGLVSAAGERNAIELGSIRETLLRIAGDDQVLDRDRRMARKLLAQAASEASPAGSTESMR